MFPQQPLDAKKRFFPKILERTDDTSKFSCGEEEINEFIHKEALVFQKQKLGITYVFHFDTEIIGFTTLCMSYINKQKMSVDNRLPKRISSYPALLIGQLSVAEEHQHSGVGTYICDFCFDRAVKLSQIVGCRFLIVNALDSAINFYTKYGFILAPNQEKEKQKLMFLDITKNNQKHLESDKQ